MMRSNPFARFKMIMAAISAAMQLTGIEKDLAMARIGTYKSRGKGRGNGRTAISYRARSKYTPHYGAKESAKFCARNKA